MKNYPEKSDKILLVERYYKKYLYCKVFKKKFYIQHKNKSHYYLYREDVGRVELDRYYDPEFPWFCSNPPAWHFTQKLKINLMEKMFHIRFDLNKSR